MNFVGLSEYAQLLQDPVFAQSLFVTGVYTAASLAAEFGFGILIAYLLFRITRGKTILTVALLLPLTIPPVISGIIWKILFDAGYGHVNYYLNLVGIGGKPWLTTATWALPAAIITDIWQWTPFIALVTYAGFSSLPRELLQSAFVDGASELKTLGEIMLPSISPLLFIALLLRLVDCIRAFDNIFSLTGGGPGTATTNLSIFVYYNAMEFMMVGYASAAGVIFLLILIVVTNLMLRRATSILWRETHA